MLAVPDSVPAVASVFCVMLCLVFTYVWQARLDSILAPFQRLGGSRASYMKFVLVVIVISGYTSVVLGVL